MLTSSLNRALSSVFNLAQLSALINLGLRAASPPAAAAAAAIVFVPNIRVLTELTLVAHPPNAALPPFQRPLATKAVALNGNFTVAAVPRATRATALNGTFTAPIVARVASFTVATVARVASFTVAKPTFPRTFVVL